MAGQAGHAAVVAFDAPVVVVVEQTLATRVALAIAGALVPLALALAWDATDGASTLDPGRTAIALGLLAAAVLTGGAVAFALGVTRARLLVDNREVDQLTWTLRPSRRLAAQVGTRALEAEVTLGVPREVSFYVDGALLKAAGVV